MMREAPLRAGSIDIAWTVDLGSFHFITVEEFFQKSGRKLIPDNVRALVGLGECPRLESATHLEEPMTKVYLLSAIEYYDRALTAKPTA